MKRLPSAPTASETGWPSAAAIAGPLSPLNPSWPIPATVVTMPFSALVGVLLYLDLRARKEQLGLETLRAELRASTA